jgi:hypothetical protein
MCPTGGPLVYVPGEAPLVNGVARLTRSASITPLVPQWVADEGADHRWSHIPAGRITITQRLFNGRPSRHAGQAPASRSHGPAAARTGNRSASLNRRDGPVRSRSSGKCRSLRDRDTGLQTLRGGVLGIGRSGSRLGTTRSRIGSGTEQGDSTKSRYESHRPSRTKACLMACFRFELILGMRNSCDQAGYLTTLGTDQ